MTKNEFIKKYWPFAKETESKTGISAIAILAQAALESAWGKCAPGNMFFGVKDTDGINGNEQLLQTTEYSQNPNLKFPVILSVEKVFRNGKAMYKYVVKTYFRKYATPEESFTDHANLFLKAPRYREALKVKSDPYKFIDEIAKAGYATAPNYSSSLQAVASTIEKLIKENNL